MVKQGKIIKLNLNPSLGHEQSGYRPALVISNDFFNKVTNLAIICPITNTQNNFPLHINLDNRTYTTGAILLEHVKTVDLNARGYIEVEDLPKDILEKVINIVFSEIEIF